MTNGSLETRVTNLENRMNQIQATLQQVAELQVVGQRQINQLGDRLETLEQAQERTQEQLELTLAIVNRSAQSIERTEKIAESNARSVQAWESLISQNRDEAEEERSQLRVDINELKQANRENVAQHLEFRERFDQVLEEIRRVSGGN